MPGLSESTNNTARPVFGSANRNPSQREGGLYGWTIVFVAAVFMCATLPGRTHGLGLIAKRLIDDFESTRLTFAQINFWATLLGALFCIPCGWLIDRFGLRRVSLAVVTALGIVVLLLSQSNAIGQVAILVMLTRGFGQSMLSVISITLIGKYFSRRLPLAMGIYAVLLSCMMAAATGLLGSQIVAVGWRSAWSIQGWLLLAVAVPCALLIRRDANEGTPLTDASVSSESIESSEGGSSATLAQAMFTPCFWLFAISISFFGLISSGLSLFNQYVLAERGFGESVYHTTLVVGLLSGLVGNLSTGALARRFPLQGLLAAALFALAAALGAFPLVAELWQVYVYAIAMGLAGGMLTVLFFTVWKHAFGQENLGTIQGAAQMITVLASALGPILVATSQSHTGSYTTVFIVAALLSALSGLWACYTHVPNALRGHWHCSSMQTSDYREPEPCPANL